MNPTSRSNARKGAMALFLLLLCPLTSPAVAAEGDWAGWVAFEGRGFPQEALQPGQGSEQASIAAQPEYYREWQEGIQSFRFTPFLRVDSLDPERTHFDIRELLWQRVGRRWEVTAGFAKVFWGVAESRHLVDIINQTDGVEDPDGEDKLGQPMVRLDLIRSWGTWEVYLLPFFRERTFAGEDGRLRTPLTVDTAHPLYESRLEERHVDLAIRWYHFIGPFDVGVSHFSGTGREPRLVPGFRVDGAEDSPFLVPLYEQIDQTAVEVQATAGAWLWKLEAFTRRDSLERFQAAVGGFEYTFNAVRGSGVDVGLLLEYLYDGRTTQPEIFEDDIFIGTRLAFNDVQSTDLLVGVVVDRETGARFFNVEGSRRLGDRWKLEFRARAFGGAEPEDPLFFLGQDDYVQIRIARYF